MIIEAVKKENNLIGRLGENEARVMRFYVGDTQRDFPGCSFAVVNRRPNDAEAYPVNSSYYTVEGEYLLWTVMSGDLTQEGIGECEIIAYVNSQIVKSEIYMTRVLRALDGAGDPPDPWQSWVQDVEEAADRAEAAAELLEHPGAQAETLDPGSEATASYSDGVFSFGIPRGADGTDGYSPSASVSKAGNKATITITDKEGTTTAEVTDGRNGQDGYSPIAQVQKYGSTATIIIKDKYGQTTAQVTDGTNGQDGYSPTASVTKSGGTATISITDKNGTTSETVSDGATGATPVISIGTVSTLSPGSDATASMDVTDPEHPVLSFGIPEGEPGNATIDDTSTANNRVWSAQKTNDLKSALSSISPKMIDGEYINASGAVTPNASRCRSDYIPCVPGITVYYIGETNHTSVSACTFFNSNKQPISPFHVNEGSLGTEFSAVAPANTAYVVISSKPAYVTRLRFAYDQTYEIIDRYYGFAKDYTDQKKEILDGEISKTNDIITNLNNTSLNTIYASFVEKHYYRTDVSVGASVSTTPIASDGYDCVMIPCTKGQLFTINVVGGSAARAYCFIDTNSIAKIVAPTYETCENFIIEAPENGYLLCNNARTNTNVYVNYRTNTLKDGYVTPQKTSFFDKKSHNMINIADADKTLRYSPGSVKIVSAEGTGYGITALIPVKPGQSYTISGNSNVASGGYFGENATLIENQQSISNIEFYTPVSGGGNYFIVPENNLIKYVALNLYKDTQTEQFNSTVQLEEGEMATEYTPYQIYYVIGEEYLPAVKQSAENGIDVLPMPSYAFEKSKIENFYKHWIKKDKDLVVAGTGTSLTARSSEHCTLRDDATSRPPLMHSNNFASRIWDRIVWEGQEYRRFDYSGFFTETGSFESSATLEEWDDASYRYGITRYASGSASVQFTVPQDAWQFNFIYRTDTSGSQNVSVAIAEGNGKMEVFNGTQWVEANGYTFSMREAVVNLTNIDVYNPNTVGNTTVHLDSYQVGGNTTYQKRLKMRCKSGSIDSRASTKTVTISSSADRFMYWGVEWSKREFMITYINAARGSHNMTYSHERALYKYQDNEIWSFKPDLIFTENPIHNSGASGGSFSSYYTTYWGYATYDFFFNTSNPISLAARAIANNVTDLEWIVFTSSISWNFNGIDENGELILSADKDGKLITALDAQSLANIWTEENEQDVIAINACKYWCDAAVAMFGDLKSATVGSGKNGNTFTNEGSHWNDTGCEVMDRCIGGVFDFYN